MRLFLKKLLPPFIIEWLNAMRTDYGWKGSYSTWEQAVSASIGYSDENIAKIVANAALKVKNGEAKYERDSVLFDKIEYSWPLLSAIFMAASLRTDKSLTVVDFGGGFGSSYYQNRKFLDYIANLKWNIVEQDSFVEIGKSAFADGRLDFYDSVSECVTMENADLLILSSVLQYLEKPYDILSTLLSHKFKVVVIDRTIVTKEYDDRICVQKVPESIYKASYPCRILSESKILEMFDKCGYRMIESFESIGWRTKSFEFNGYIFGLK